MTISIYKEFSSDLFWNANWPLFSERRELKNRLVSLDAYSITIKDPDRDTDALHTMAAKELERRLALTVSALGFTLQIFPVHLTLQPKSAIVMHRKIWKSLPKTNPPVGVRFESETSIECNARVRFASLATIPMGAISWMVSMVRGFEIIVPLLLPTPLDSNEKTIVELTRVAFPPDGCRPTSDFDWAAFACNVAERGGICVRQTANLADGEFAMDFFGGRADLLRLTGIFENDDGLGKFTTH